MKRLLYALIAWLLHHPRCPEECPTHRERWLSHQRPGFRAWD